MGIAASESGTMKYVKLFPKETASIILFSKQLLKLFLQLSAISAHSGDVFLKLMLETALRTADIVQMSTKNSGQRPLH